MDQLGGQGLDQVRWNLGIVASFISYICILYQLIDFARLCVCAHLFVRNRFNIAECAFICNHMCLHRLDMSPTSIRVASVCSGGGDDDVVVVYQFLHLYNPEKLCCAKSQSATQVEL